MVTKRELRMPEGDGRKSLLKELLWFGVSAAIIAGMVYFAGIEDFLVAITKANLWYIAPALVLGVSTGLVWSFSWYRVFQKVDIPATFRESVNLQFAGSFLNSITPLGQAGGEPFMAYIISSNTDSSYEKAFSAVLSADIINVIPAFTFVLGGTVYMLFFHSISNILIEILYLAFLAIGVGGVLVYLLWFKAGRIEGFILGVLGWISAKVGRGEKYVRKAEKRLLKFEDAMREVGNDPKYLAKTVMMIHTGFVLEVLTLYFVLVSLGINPLLSSLYFVLPLADIANTSPTPGGSGTYEAAMGWLLSILTPANFAVGLSAAIIYRLMTYWPMLFIGYFAFHGTRNGGA
ncbi:MAG: YbhN family protein [Candidatus Aenigmatarchaeota archaeon]